MITGIIWSLLFVVSLSAGNKNNEYTYTDSSVLLSSKRTNIYYINEISNVCFDNGKLIFFGPSYEERSRLLEVANQSGFTSQIKDNAAFTKEVQSMDTFEKNVIGLFLATTSQEDFQAYRLYNSILYLHRNGVDLSTVSSVYLYTGRQLTQQMTAMITHYSTAIHSLLGSNLKIKPIRPFCFQQLIFVTPRDDVKDVIYQLDSIYLKKLVYKGKPQYPIPPRSNHILVNFRKEAPKWKDEAPVRKYFDTIYKAKKVMTYVTFSELSHDVIINHLKDTDIFVTTYGDDSVFLVFMVPYSVFVEVQPDYFHDSTTSIIAYSSDIYPIILRDVYSDIPRECKVVDSLIQSEEPKCRKVLKYRDIVFDVKSMTQAMAQSVYYLNNYKMKVVKYYHVCYNKLLWHPTATGFAGRLIVGVIPRGLFKLHYGFLGTIPMSFLWVYYNKGFCDENVNNVI